MELICPICMDDLIGINNTVTTECGHKFHASCLMQNIAHNGFSCPYCRNVMIEDISETEEEEEEDETEIDDDEYEEEEDEEQEDDDDINSRMADNERMYNRTLVCVRNLFAETDEEHTIRPPPPVEWITQKMIERGFTLDRFVKAILMDYDDYNDIEEECLDEADTIYEHILNIVEEYKSNTNA